MAEDFEEEDFAPAGEVLDPVHSAPAAQVLDPVPVHALMEELALEGLHLHHIIEEDQALITITHIIDRTIVDVTTTDPIITEVGGIVHTSGVGIIVHGIILPCM
ncbi:hypothetical protein WKT22_01763 [Candidatus Lokiarchaeum ossiferum]